MEWHELPCKEKRSVVVFGEDGKTLIREMELYEVLFDRERNQFWVLEETGLVRTQIPIR